MRNAAKFLYSVILVGVTAWLCSYFTRFGIDNWYSVLEKPAGTPPNEIFAPVWSLIYGLLAVSFYLVLSSSSPLRRPARQLFIAQLFMQIIWCILFFYEGMLGAALGVIILLDLIVGKMISIFGQIKPLAGYLNYPYLLWLCYATYLNFIFMSAQGAVVEF